MTKLVVACVAALAAFAGLARGADEIPVRSTEVSEIEPAAAGDYLAWSQSSSGDPHHFDAFVARSESPPVKINAPGSQGRLGAIDGETVVYQEVVGRRSDIKLFDLRTGRRRNPPRGVNTSQYESRPARSGRFLLFNRLDRSRSLERVLLFDLAKHRSIVLLRERYRPPRFRAVAGQVSGNYAVGTHCQVVCAVFRYDIRARRMRPVPASAIPEASDFAPSVTSEGTVYFARRFSLGRCSANDPTLLLRARLGETRTSLVVTLPPRTGVGSTYASGTAGAATVHYSRGVCLGKSDIYRVADEQPFTGD